MKQQTWAVALMVGLLSAGGAAQAALIPYTSAGVDLVYDNDYTPAGASSPGLTWMADANLAETMTFGVTGIASDGGMRWEIALEWITAMNTANYAGANDWRLWSALNSDGSAPCADWDCTGSELGHLFYIEGGLAQGDNINDSTALTSVFTNMENILWAGTAFSSNDAWGFNAGNGRQRDYGTGQTYFAWAVRSGQIGAAPLPGTALLMALGFGSMAFLRRARRRLW